MSADQRGGRRHPVAGQLGQPPRRHQRLDTELPQLQAADHGDLVQVLRDRLAAAARRRAPAPPFQVRQPGPVGDLGQPVQRAPLGGVREPGDVHHIWRVNSSRTLATSRASVVTPGTSTFRSRSHASPSAKIAFGPSPVARDRAATHRRTLPRLRRTPGSRGRAGSPTGGRTASSPAHVPLHLRRAGHAQLPGDEVQHLTRHIQRVLQERPEPPHRGQLQRDAGPHVLPAMPPDQLQVIVIQKTRSRSACDERPVYRPYAAASSSVRNSTGIDHVATERH